MFHNRKLGQIIFYQFFSIETRVVFWHLDVAFEFLNFRKFFFHTSLDCLFVIDSMTGFFYAVFLCFYFVSCNLIGLIFPLFFNCCQQKKTQGHCEVVN